MKNKSPFFALLIILLSPFTIQSQQDTHITEVFQFMSQGEKPGLSLAIKNIDPVTVEKEWKKYLQQFKAKVIQPKKEKEIFGDNATIPKMSANTVDIYAYAVPKEYGTQLTAYFNLGGSYVSSWEHQVAYANAREFLNKFNLMITAKTLDIEFKSQNETLKVLNKELAKMLNSKTQSIKEVEKAKSVISQREQDLISLEKLIQTKQQQLDIQNEIIKTLKAKLK